LLLEAVQEVEELLGCELFGICFSAHVLFPFLVFLTALVIRFLSVQSPLLWQQAAGEVIQ
jgi:hypothetical protein